MMGSNPSARSVGASFQVCRSSISRIRWWRCESYVPFCRPNLSMSVAFRSP